VTTPARTDGVSTAASVHVVICIYCKGVISPILADLGSVGCHSCRTGHAA